MIRVIGLVFLGQQKSKKITTKSVAKIETVSSKMISENNDFSKQNRKFNIFLGSPITVNNFPDQNQ